MAVLISHLITGMGYRLSKLCLVRVYLDIQISLPAGTGQILDFEKWPPFGLTRLLGCFSVRLIDSRDTKSSEAISYKLK